MLLTLSGIDCSGKSTQIERLIAGLEARGHRTRRFWFRPGYSREMDTLRSVVRRLRPGAIPPPGKSSAREQTFARPGVARAWMTMALADSMLQYALKLRALLTAGFTVVCDRYVYDARLDLQLRFPDQTQTFALPLDLVEWSAPRPDLALLLTLPRAEMLRRMALKREPFPDAPALRDRRYAAYERLAAVGPVTAIDAARPIDVVAADVMSHVERQLHT